MRPSFFLPAQQPRLPTASPGGDQDAAWPLGSAALASHPGWHQKCKNAKPWTPDTVGARARNDILRATKHLGRARWRRGNGCHRRSRAETKMNCFKLLGQRLMARDFDRQVPKSRSVSPASIVTRHLQFPSPSPLHKSPRGRRSSNPNAYSCNSAPDDPVALAAEPLRRRLADSATTIVLLKTKSSRREASRSTVLVVCIVIGFEFNEAVMHRRPDPI